MEHGIQIIYLIIVVYFVLGAIGFFFINRKKEPAEARQSWIKYGTYCVIIHILFFSMAIQPLVFRCLSLLIIGMGGYELFALYRNSGYRQTLFFLLSMVVFLMFGLWFYCFGRLTKGPLLFVFLVLSVFDSFSQIAGQLWGRRKIIPKISPQKTWEGLAGGVVTALISAVFFDRLIGSGPLKAIPMAAGIVLFAFIGDMLASFYKRRYRVKDFNRLIPGHGGFLDRFDSLIAGGAWFAFLKFVLYS
jgi:phosphatidate cytidylyltransferase